MTVMRLFRSEKSNLPDKTRNYFFIGGQRCECQEHSKYWKRVVLCGSATKRSTVAEIYKIMPRARPTDHPQSFYGYPVAEIAFCRRYT